MNLVLAKREDLHRIAQFMTQMNQNEETACAHLGDVESENYEYLEELYEEDVKCCYYIEEDGWIVAAIAGDRCEDNQSIEVLGPYVSPECLKREEKVEQMILRMKNWAAGYRLKFFHPCVNTLISQVILSMGGRCNGRNYSMEFLLKNTASIASTQISWVNYQKKSCTIADAAIQIAAIHDRIFPKSYYSGSTIVERVDAQHWLVFCHDGDIVTAYASFDAEQDGYLDFIATVREYRNRGYAKCLLTAVCEILREAGASKVSITVAEDDQEALELYHRFGFKEVRFCQGFIME